MLCGSCCFSNFQSLGSNIGKESLDRTDDKVYESTTAVVRSVMSLTQKAPSVKSDELVDLIKVCKAIFVFPKMSHPVQPGEIIKVDQLFIINLFCIQKIVDEIYFSPLCNQLTTFKLWDRQFCWSRLY